MHELKVNTYYSCWSWSFFNGAAWVENENVLPEGNVSLIQRGKHCLKRKGKTGRDIIHSQHGAPLKDSY